VVLVAALSASIALVFMLVPVYGIEDAGNTVFVVTLQCSTLLKTLLVRLVGINTAILSPE
jgi:hypothetical protein